MKTASTILLVVFALLVAGCPPHSYGIYRYHEIENSELPISCIEKTIKSTPGVKFLDLKVSDGGQTVTLSGLLPPDKIHDFWYSYNHQKNRISIIQKTNDGLHYHHAAISYDKEEANTLVSTLIDVMTKIDKKIESNCDLTYVVNKSSVSCDVEACKNGI